MRVRNIVTLFAAALLAWPFACAAWAADESNVDADRPAPPLRL